MMREVIVAMLVMRAVMQPVEDELADDDGWLERVILEGCPFLWGWRGYSSGGRGDFCWGGRGMSVGKIGIPRTPAGRVSGRGSWGVRGQKGV